MVVRTYHIGTSIIRLCHNFLIGKGQTCALRTTCVRTRVRTVPLVRTYHLAMVPWYVRTRVHVCTYTSTCTYVRTRVPIFFFWYIPVVRMYYVRSTYVHLYQSGTGGTPTSSVPVAPECLSFKLFFVFEIMLYLYTCTNGPMVVLEYPWYTCSTMVLQYLYALALPMVLEYQVPLVAG